MKKEFDIAAASIERPEKDRRGAEIFEIQCGTLGMVRVLHFDREEAEALAREYAVARLWEFSGETISVEAAALAGLL